MSDHNISLFFDICTYAIVSVALFAIMELLKPGIIMHYLNLPYMAVFVILLAVVSVIIKSIKK